MLTQSQKDTALDLAKHNFGVLWGKDVTKECFGVDTSKNDKKKLLSWMIIQALQFPNVTNKITIDEEELLYRRLACLLNIQVD